MITSALESRLQAKRHMDAKQLIDTPDEKVWALIFETGDEAMEGLLRFAREHSITAAPIQRHWRLFLRDAGLFRLGNETIRSNPGG